MPQNHAKVNGIRKGRTAFKHSEKKPRAKRKPGAGAVLNTITDCDTERPLGHYFKKGDCKEWEYIKALK